jgi:hypothetical protein
MFPKDTTVNMVDAFVEPSDSSSFFQILLLHHTFRPSFSKIKTFTGCALHHHNGDASSPSGQALLFFFYATALTTS